MPHTDPIATAAEICLGYDQFRPGQHEAISAVLDGHDTLAVMSTGSGKSAIYQLAGHLLGTPTLVVSPLISLQHDQIDAISSAGFARAAALDGSLTEAQRDERLTALADRELDFLFLAPEQLARPETTQALADAGVGLLVIDEAHCISEWGHDFRPDYLRLGALVEALGHPTVLALTATAAPPVREEILERLAMSDPRVIVRGFDRPNLWLEVEAHEHERTKHDALIARVGATDRPGIVYVATRAEADELAEELAGAGFGAAPYHAGLPKKRRDETQERFMAGELELIVATTAFGMGVDKANVRFVFHLEPSDSLDSYYQEIGRAGRDGEPAAAVLFYRPTDIGRRRFFAAGGVDAETIATVADELARRRAPVPVGELRERLSLSQTRVMTALSRLEDAGAVTVDAHGEVDPHPIVPSQVAEYVEAAAALEESRQNVDRSRLDMMRGYAEHPHCRRAFVLSYFGEPFDGACGHCDNCAAGRGDSGAVAEDVPFTVGAAVRHAEWGVGAVQRYEADRVVVLFDSEGYKTLELEAVLERELLSPADRADSSRNRS